MPIVFHQSPTVGHTAHCERRHCRLHPLLPSWATPPPLPSPLPPHPTPPLLVGAPLSSSLSLLPSKSPMTPSCPAHRAPALSAPIAPSPGPTLVASSLAISLITASLSPLLTSCQVLQSSIFDEMDLVASLTICFIFLLHAFLAIKELPPQRRRQQVEGAVRGRWRCMKGALRSWGRGSNGGRCKQGMRKKKWGVIGAGDVDGAVEVGLVGTPWEGGRGRGAKGHHRLPGG